jgi:uncharacterized protein YbjT (DUF2867 family)
MLGGSILEALLAKQLAVRVLMRPGKPDVEAGLRQRGVDIAHGDVLDSSSLPAAMRDVRVVVSSLNNNPDMFVQGHRRLLEAAEHAAVERFVPSDFSVDFFRLQPAENFNLAMRHEVAALFAGTRVRPIHLLIGAFMDTILDRRTPFIDWSRNVLPYFGDPGQPCDFTSVADAGRYVAEAVADPRAPEILRFAGEVLTMPELAAGIARGLEIPLTAERRGDADELAAIIAEKQRTATNPWEWIALQYHHNMVSGRAKLQPLDNPRYPQIGPESVEAFARRNRTVDIQGMSRSDVPR